MSRGAFSRASLPGLRTAPAEAGSGGSRAVFSGGRGLVAALLFAACAGDVPPVDDEPAADAPATERAAPAPASEPWLTDVAAAAGIDFEHVRGRPSKWYFPEIMGGGAAWLDADGDGDLDLYLVQSGSFDEGAPERPGNALYANRGDGTFADVTAAAGVGDRGYGMGVTVGDVDGDGRDDLYVTNVGPDVLYRNRGDGTFEDVTAAAGLGDPGWGTSAVFFDADGDGDLDLYVTRYVHWSPAADVACFAGGGGRDYCHPETYPPQADLLYRNEGARGGVPVFREIGAEAGIRRAAGSGLGVAVADFDGDGRLDLYVANDGDPNQLWIAAADGRYEDRALYAGCAVNRLGMAEAGMGVAVFDLGDDGDLDLFVTHLRDESNTLYAVDGLLFEDVTAAAGLAAPSLALTGFGVVDADLDHDGTVDLYVANGRVGRTLRPLREDDAFAEPDQLFRGLGGGRFAEVLPRGGTAAVVIANGRAAAAADYDEDGDVDLVVVTNGGPARLLRNDAGARGRWIAFRVTDRHGHDAIGARLRLRAAGVDRYRVVRRAASYAASHDPRAHFGLATTGQVDEVVVDWPGGVAESFGPFAADRVYELRQGEGDGGV